MKEKYGGDSCSNSQYNIRVATGSTSAHDRDKYSEDQLNDVAPHSDWEEGDEKVENEGRPFGTSVTEKKSDNPPPQETGEKWKREHGS